MSWDPVYRFVQRIPRGSVLTYGALARARQNPHPRTIRFAAKKTPRERRRQNRRVARRPETSPLETIEKSSAETQSHAQAYWKVKPRAGWFARYESSVYLRYAIASFSRTTRQRSIFGFGCRTIKDDGEPHSSS